METNLKTLNNLLMIEMTRVMELDTKDIDFKKEIERSKTLSGNAMNYIKCIQTSFRIKEYADKNKLNLDKLNEELGNK